MTAKAKAKAKKAAATATKKPPRKNNAAAAASKITTERVGKNRKRWIVKRGKTTIGKIVWQDAKKRGKYWAVSVSGNWIGNDASFDAVVAAITNWRR